MKKCNQNLKESLAMLEELQDLALKGKMSKVSAEDLKLYSLIWDISTQLFDLVQNEISNHKKLGKWH